MPATQCVRCASLQLLTRVDQELSQPDCDEDSVLAAHGSKQ